VTIRELVERICSKLGADFSRSVEEHNRAVSKYQRGGR